MAELPRQQMLIDIIHPSLVLRGSGGQIFLRLRHVVLVLGRAFCLDLIAFEIAVPHVAVQVQAFRAFHVRYFCVVVNNFPALPVVIECVKNSKVRILHRIVFDGRCLVQLGFDHNVLVLLFLRSLEGFLGGQVFDKKGHGNDAGHNKT